MITRLLALLLLLSVTFYRIDAQGGEDYEPIPSRGRFYIAPDFGLVIGYPTRIELSPVLGYYLLERISIAAGARYEYYFRSDRYKNIGVSGYETHIYGPRAYVRFTVIRNLSEILPLESNVGIFAHTEFQTLSLENQYFRDPDLDGRFWYSTVLLGGGITQPASERVRINVVALWDVDSNSMSPFSNPILNFGVQIFLGKLY